MTHDASVATRMRIAPSRRLRALAPRCPRTDGRNLCRHPRGHCRPSSAPPPVRCGAVRGGGR
eukprot:5250174-Alexandrium_andersonii.AAC.1